MLRQAATAAADPRLRRYFSTPRPLEFPTEGGLTAFAHYYPPHNPDYAAPQGEKPPLVVKCHGGPTSSASSVLDLRIQYWTSRGIAVLDVDYGGSTGYGRAYRGRLEGHGASSMSRIASTRRAIRGVGPGRPRPHGHHRRQRRRLYSPRRAARRDLFRGGASYYGVSDIAALARDTHKFESRYLDWLIGPYPDRADLYPERSPLTHAAGLRRPVIFFQGSEDRIVPPNQTETMVDALRGQGIPVGYLSSPASSTVSAAPRTSSARSMPSSIFMPRWSSARP